MKLVSSYAHARRPGPTLLLGNTALLGNSAPAAGSSAASGTHAISRARGDERQRLEQIEQELERLQAKLTQVEAERDRFQEQLARALEEITTLHGERAPQATSIEPVLAPPPVASVQGLSRVALRTLPAPEPRDREHDVALRQGIEFEVEFLDDTHLFSGLTQDISQGGLFVATYRGLPIGSRISLTLELTGGTLELQGEVRWARPESEALGQRPGYGVAFRDLSHEALAALRELSRSHPPRYYDC